jgi:hypothetical protein
VFNVLFVGDSLAKNNLNTEWLRKLDSLFFILPKDVAVFTKKLSVKKINGNNFVQLSLFLSNNCQCHCHEFQY